MPDLTGVAEQLVRQLNADSTAVGESLERTQGGGFNDPDLTAQVNALREVRDQAQLEALGGREQLEILSAEFDQAMIEGDDVLANDIEGLIRDTETNINESEVRAEEADTELQTIPELGIEDDINPEDVEAVKENLEKMYVGMSFQNFQRSMATIKEMDSE